MSKEIVSAIDKVARKIGSSSNTFREDNLYYFNQCEEIRKFEIGLFWQRSIFFTLFILGCFAGIGAFYKSSTHLTFGISFFGFCCSLIWYFAGRASKFWQENWEQKTSNNPHMGEIFLKGTRQKKNFLLDALEYSPSRLAILLSLFVTICFGLISLFYGTIIFIGFSYTELLKVIHSTIIPENNYLSMLMLLTILLFPILIIILTCKSKPNKKDTN